MWKTVAVTRRRRGSRSDAQQLDQVLAEEADQRDDLVAVVLHREAEARQRGAEAVVALLLRAVVGDVLDRRDQRLVVVAEVQASGVDAVARARSAAAAARRPNRAGRSPVASIGLGAGRHCRADARRPAARVASVHCPASRRRPSPGSASIGVDARGGAWRSRVMDAQRGALRRAYRLPCRVTGCASPDHGTPRMPAQARMRSHAACRQHLAAHHRLCRAHRLRGRDWPSRLHTYGTTAQRLEGALVARSTQTGAGLRALVEPDRHDPELSAIRRGRRAPATPPG